TDRLACPAAKKSHRTGLFRGTEPLGNRVQATGATRHREKLDSHRPFAPEGRTTNSNVSNTDPFREMVEAYALGALDAEDRAAFEAHLATHCADCAKSLEEARWLVSQLAYLAPAAAPSDMLKGRLMQTVRTGIKNVQNPPQTNSGSSST